MPDCILCQIVRRELPARIVHEDEPVVARDLARAHLRSAREAATDHEAALGRMITVAVRVARGLGVGVSGYRLAGNTGDGAGQTLFHRHRQDIGRRKLGPEG